MFNKISIPRFFDEFDESGWKAINNYNCKKNSKLFIDKNFKMPETNSSYKITGLGSIYLPEEVRKKATERKRAFGTIHETDPLNNLELDRDIYLDKLSQKIEFHNENISDLKQIQKKESKQTLPIIVNIDLIRHYPILHCLKKYVLKSTNNSNAVNDGNNESKFEPTDNNFHKSKLKIQMDSKEKNNAQFINSKIPKSISKKFKGNNLKLVKSPLRRSQSNCVDFKEKYISDKTRISDFLKPVIFQNKSDLTLNKEINLLLQQEKIENNYFRKKNRQNVELNAETMSIII